METRAPGDVTVAILSDIHYAGPAERARGEDYEFRIIANPLLRAVARAYRHLIWMRHPLEQGRQLDRFLAEVPPVDYLVANGDYSCDSGFVGVSDPAAFQSAQECLGKLRAKFGDRAWFTLGDHELGKLPLFGGKGGMRLASWHCATKQLGLQPFWKFSVGRYLLMGVSSPLICPAREPAGRVAGRMAGMAADCARRTSLKSAPPSTPCSRNSACCCSATTRRRCRFCAREESVRRRLPQVEQTILGHLHTRLILWKSRLLSGIPPIRFLGRNVSRFTSALHEAHHWWPFRCGFARHCPASNC